MRPDLYGMVALRPTQSSKKEQGRVGSIPVSVSAISIYWHISQYRQYRYRQSKMFQQYQYQQYRYIGRGRYRHIGVSAKIWSQPGPSQRYAVKAFDHEWIVWLGETLLMCLFVCALSFTAENRLRSTLNHVNPI